MEDHLPITVTRSCGILTHFPRTLVNTLSIAPE